MLKVAGETEIKIGLEIFQKNNICENSSTSFKASFTDPDMVYCQCYKVETKITDELKAGEVRKAFFKELLKDTQRQEDEKQRTKRIC